MCGPQGRCQSCSLPSRIWAASWFCTGLLLAAHLDRHTAKPCLMGLLRLSCLGCMAGHKKTLNSFWETFMQGLMIQAGPAWPLILNRWLPDLSVSSLPNSRTAQSDRHLQTKSKLGNVGSLKDGSCLSSKGIAI